MLELFAGQLSYNDIMHNISYRELLLIREKRIKRKLAEREEMEKEHARELEERNREFARNAIMQ